MFRCYRVPAGHKSVDLRRSIAFCPVGTSSIGGTEDCTACESGKYSDTPGASSCTKATICGAGEFIVSQSTATMDTVCEDCSEGKSSSGVKLQHWVACGGGNGACVEDDVPMNNEETFPVRCCSDTAIEKWIRRPNQDGDLCPIWTESSVYGVAWGFDCQQALSFNEAKDFCAAVGGRLCTKEEVNDHCAEGTGCATTTSPPHSFDEVLIWTSSPIYLYVGEDSCTACNGDGQYSDVVKAASCKVAPAGFIPNADHTGLESCPQNTYSIGASNLEALFQGKVDPV